jgi:hypothetical protein
VPGWTRKSDSNVIPVQLWPDAWPSPKLARCHDCRSRREKLAEVPPANHLPIANCIRIPDPQCANDICVLTSADPGVSGSGGVGRLNDRLRGRSASVVVLSRAAWRGCRVWPWRIGSARGRGFDCAGLRVARWVANRYVRASFCVARRCSPLAFRLVTPYLCWSVEVPGLHGMQEVSGSSPLSSTRRTRSGHDLRAVRVPSKIV